jgi:ZIP family zinc transporter
MTPYLIGLAASLSTFSGALVALRYKDRLHLVLGFSAGAVMAVAVLDLLREAIELAIGLHDTLTVLAVALAGSLIYMCFDRAAARDDGEHEERRGHLGAASLTVHSFLDGLAIGLAFKVSTKVGIPVAVAVLAHDFSDGINTVNISLVGGIREKGTRLWVVADALAPLVGVAAASVFAVTPGRLSPVLALFAGFFLYLGWSELSPESYHRHPKKWTTLSTIAGAALMYVIIRISG